MHRLNPAQAKNIFGSILWFLVTIAVSVPLSNNPLVSGLESEQRKSEPDSSTLVFKTWDSTGSKYNPNLDSLPEISTIGNSASWKKNQSVYDEVDDIGLVRGFMDSDSDQETETPTVTKNGSTDSSDRDGGPEPEVEAFSVGIAGDRVFGGLVTYSHSQHPAQICRVMNACLRIDGTLVLPEWMRRHDNTLNFHCGHSKLEFSLQDTAVPAALKNTDLIGLKSSRASMPHFLEDFIPNAVIFDLVYGDHQVSKTCHSRIGENCEVFPGLSQDFRPAILLHRRLQKLSNNSWVPQFIKLMKPRDIGRQATVLYNGVSVDTMTCFKSAFFTRGPYNKNTIMADHLRNIHFFDLNGIGKKSRNVLKASTHEGSEQQTCSLNVTLSNRKLVDGARNRLIGRYIMNLPELRDAIIKQAKRIPGLSLRVETMTLEGRSIRWQINGMQKTDIWVAGHSPLLTNMLFLRENSTVMEIQPFSYYPQTYEKMARHLAHVKYDRYIAHPDLEGFEKCIRSMYPRKHPSFQKSINFLEKFSKAAQKYEQSDSTHSLTLHNFKEPGLRYVTNCAQMQRLDTSAKNLAIAIVRHARLRCGFPKPPLKNIDQY